jgi:hypothetical protein
LRPIIATKWWGAAGRIATPHGAGFSPVKAFAVITAISEQDCRQGTVDYCAYRAKLHLGNYIDTGRQRTLHQNGFDRTDRQL